MKTRVVRCLNVEVDMYDTYMLAKSKMALHNIRHVRSMTSRMTDPFQDYKYKHRSRTIKIIRIDIILMFRFPQCYRMYI